ncbi:MAG TPA: hypothetical protein VJC06_01635 [Candidatus Paceibacterota bacterium]
MSNNKLKLVISSVYASIITIVFVVVITVWAELSVPLKDWLKNFSGHHWTSKSIFSVLLYSVTTIIFYLLPNKHGENRLKTVLEFLLVVTLLGVIAVMLFFTGHHFQIF